MITVAIIAILAVVAVPAFSSQSRSSKAQTEVGAMLGELAVRQDQYKLENGTYLATTACPASPSAGGVAAAACIAAGTPWAQLHVKLPTEELRCSYATTVGSSAAGATFEIVATCESVTFFVTSEDSKIQQR
jgi:Tfp pilus assembly protein PilE